MSDYIARALRRLAARVSTDPLTGAISIEEQRTRLGRIYETQQTPAQITADQDNYDLGARGVKRLDADAPRSITGIIAGNDWTAYEVWNVGAHAITFKHQSSSSMAANRIICGGAADIELATNDGARLRYDVTTGRYRAWLL